MHCDQCGINEIEYYWEEDDEYENIYGTVIHIKRMGDLNICGYCSMSFENMELARALERFLDNKVIEVDIEL